MALDVEALEKAGFKKQMSTRQWETRNAELAESEMSQSGPYVIDYVLKKGDVVITEERNTDTQEQGGMEMVVRHPPVVVIEGPRGRIACDPTDTKLVLSLVEAVG